MKMLIRNVLQPIVTRLGTAIGAFLIGHGMPAETAADVVTSFAAIALFAIDLGTRAYFNRRTDQ